MWRPLSGTFGSRSPTYHVMRARPPWHVNVVWSKRKPLKLASALIAWLYVESASVNVSRLPLKLLTVGGVPHGGFRSAYAAADATSAVNTATVRNLPFRRALSGLRF